MTSEDTASQGQAGAVSKVSCPYVALRAPRGQRAQCLHTAAAGGPRAPGCPSAGSRYPQHAHQPALQGTEHRRPVKLGLRALRVCTAHDLATRGCGKSCARRQKSWVLISSCDGANLLSEPQLPSLRAEGLEQEDPELGARNRCSLGWPLPFGEGVVSSPHLTAKSWHPVASPRTGSGQNLRAQDVKGVGAPGAPRAPEGSCSGGKQIPLWL